MSTGPTAQNDAPAACSLDAAGAARQLDTFAALCERALVDFERGDTSVAFRFRDEEDVRRSIDEYVGVERGCCGFLDFTVEDREGLPVLRIVAGEGTPAAVLHSMYGPPGRA
ncbi:MAG TPA: hypothetical protein VF517_16245 [Thermoleophilaceae bacterium]|jgi:hypothetical protein